MRITAMLLSAICVATAGCDRSPTSASCVVGVFGSAGQGPGSFAYPRAIATAPDGCVFVVDKSARVQRFSPDGTFETQWRMPEYAAGKPVGLSVAADGRVFVADTHYHRVIVFDRDGVELARFGELGTGDGQFKLPTDVAIDRDGNIYVSEYNGNDRITQWSPDYVFVRVVVAGEVAGRVLRRPASIVIDRDETLWVADACNHRILRFDLQGKLLTSFGEMGRAPGQLRYPYDIDIDSHGRVVVCEYGNSRVQWFDQTGRSLQVWGGPGREVGQLSSPWGVSLGPADTVYVLDSLNARVQIVRL